MRLDPFQSECLVKETGIEHAAAVDLRRGQKTKCAELTSGQYAVEWIKQDKNAYITLYWMITETNEYPVLLAKGVTSIEASPRP